jgi:hypothetical protein
VGKSNEPPVTPTPAANALLARIGRLDFVGRGMALTVLARLPSMAPAVDQAVSYAAEMLTGDTVTPPLRHDGAQGQDPAIEQLQAEFPSWDITAGLYDMIYAEHRHTGRRAHGEDPTDLRDQIRAVIYRGDATL